MPDRYPNERTSEGFLATLQNQKPPPGIACNPDKYLMAGALGGAMIGMMTGYFRLDRIATPTSPFPAKSSQDVHEGTRLMIRCSALAWRVTKRMVVGSLLFPFIVCQLQGERKKAGVITCALAGGMTGAIFGLRGGPMGVVNGSATFAVFGGVLEFSRRVRGRE